MLGVLHVHATIMHEPPLGKLVYRDGFRSDRPIEISATPCFYRKIFRHEPEPQCSRDPVPNHYVFFGFTGLCSPLGFSTSY